MTEKQKETHRRSVKNWAKNHPEKRKAINLRYRERHREELRKKSKEWRDNLSKEERKALYKRNYELYKARCKDNPEYGEYCRKKAIEAVHRYIDTHKEQVRARHKAWVEKNKEWCAEYARKRRKTKGAMIREVNKAYRDRNKSEINRKKREYRARTLERSLERERKAEKMRKERKQTDAEYYAKRRASARIARAKRSVVTRGKYRPAFDRRIPDWMVMGQEMIDKGSPYLINNQTEAMQAFAKGLVIERHEILKKGNKL